MAAVQEGDVCYFQRLPPLAKVAAAAATEEAVLDAPADLRDPEYAHEHEEEAAVIQPGRRKEDRHHQALHKLSDLDVPSIAVIQEAWVRDPFLGVVWRTLLKQAGLQPALWQGYKIPEGVPRPNAKMGSGTWRYALTATSRLLCRQRGYW